MKIKIAIFVLFVCSQVAAAQDAPPNAKPGKCYAKCLMPDKNETLGSEEKPNLIRAGGVTEWREVLCGEKISSETVRKIQESLFAFGYGSGVPDKIMNANTKAALTKFQQDKGLPIGNLDLETLSALGIHY